MLRFVPGILSIIVYILLTVVLPGNKRIADQDVVEVDYEIIDDNNEKRSLISAPKNQDPKKRLTKMLEKELLQNRVRETFGFWKISEVIDFPQLFFTRSNGGR